MCSASISDYFKLTEDQKTVSYSDEAQEAVKNRNSHARALRRVAKRREALATARPFSIATIGFCDAFLYCNGVLCYTLDDRIRVIDLHHPSHFETVISIPRLLVEAILEVNDCCKGSFRVLYCSNGIISCLFKTSGPDTTAWLVALHLESRSILIAHELDSTDRIFSRHNDQFLYYGTHSEVGADGFKRWVLYGYEFAANKWFEQKVHLPDMVGSEIGATVCFEFYNGFMYALSNQTSFEVEEIDWTSFYHCVRFPLNSPCMELVENTQNESMWRRQHQEGPIDDRWTTLRLDVDEASGELRIIEARKEWHLGSSKSQRTYYTTKIIFPDAARDKDIERAHLLAAEAASLANLTSLLPTNQSSVPPAVSDTSGSSSISSISSASSASGSSSSSTASVSTSTISSASLDTVDISGLPVSQLLKLLQSDDHPHYLEVKKPRLPEETHHGNDGSMQPTHTLAKSRIRAYHTSCNTFMDLVDDPISSGWTDTQRLRLRAGTRKLKPPLLDSNGYLCEPSNELEIALEQRYTVPPITYWPPAQDSDDQDLNEVYTLLNPPSHLGNVEGAADERSMVYATGGYDAPQALIFLSFDPAIKLSGLKNWGGLLKQDVGDILHNHDRTASNFVAFVEDDAHDGWSEAKGKGKKMVYEDVEEREKTVGIDKKGKSKADEYHCECGPWVQDCPENFVDVDIQNSAIGGMVELGSNGPWAWDERAMYLDIGLGLNFALEKKMSTNQGGWLGTTVF